MRPQTAFLPIVAMVVVLGCDKSEGAAPASSGAPAAGGSATATVATKTATKVEKVSMNGIAWEVTMPTDMAAPQYKVTNPEYLGEDDLALKLMSNFPKFSTVDGYIERNVATKVLEKKQVGAAFLVIAEPQTAGTFTVTGIVPNETIGWSCTGSSKREADIRAMCESVKYRKE